MTMRLGVRMMACAAIAMVAGSALAAAEPVSGAANAATPPPPPAAAADDLSKPTLYVVGYSHLDTQWRWTYAQTIEQFIPDTLRENFKLFEKYPAYVFNFSGSRRYQMMREYYPEDYARMKREVAAGRWFPCGSSVDENDANVPSGESLVRQVLYGNKFFRQELGTASDEFMLPDCFGFPAALPSVLAHCGIKGFSTQKLTWNAVVPIPFKVGVWEGPDGRGVMAALDPGSYVGDVKEDLTNSAGWLARIEATGQKAGVFTDYHYFGTGDQGGAPKESSVAMVQKSVDSTAAGKGKVRVISAPADRMFKSIPDGAREKLPRYRGELMLTEHSAGSVTSQAYMKRWNRKTELLADAAERAAIVAERLGGAAYPAAKFEEAWYLILGSQMHDILPGTSVPKAYEMSWNDEVLAANMLETEFKRSVGTIAAAMAGPSEGDVQRVVVYNPLSWAREDVVEAEVPGAGGGNADVRDPQGERVPAQYLSQSKTGARIAFLARVEPMSFTVFEIRQDKPNGLIAMPRVSDDGRTLENARLIVKIDERGDVSSVFDKLSKRETLSAPVRLGLHYENPREWPAWNQDWNDRKLPAKSFAGASGPVGIRVVERGPARVAVEITREAEGSTFVQMVRLCGGESDAAARVEFDTVIDWRTRERSLRAWFPLAAKNAEATYDIQQGAISRGNGRKEQYEYSFHHWFDLTDASGSFGASVLCDSKYGADKPDDSTVRLTLLHTPGTQGGYPDQGTQDIGRHRVLYALYPHAGDWNAGRSYVQGARLNQPLMAFAAPGREGPSAMTKRSLSSMAVSDPAVSVMAAKKAEAGDEIIVRLREHSGKARSGVKVSAFGPIASAREVDGQEREIGKASVVGGELVTNMPGFGLRAFALQLESAGKPSQVAANVSVAVPLTFDTDGVSTRDRLSDGAMDGAGGAYPGEQWPAKVTAGGVEFTLGPAAAGQKNAVACRGQTIGLPDGVQRVAVLCAADADIGVEFAVGAVKQRVGVQRWNGYIGQWDNRLWPHDTSDYLYHWNDQPTGLEPGYIKPAAVAWTVSHHHTPKGNTFYDFCYLFMHELDVPTGATTLTLPDDPRVKVFAVSGLRGPAPARPASPLFDTLADHVQDAPRIVPASQNRNDSLSVSIEPGLYWKAGSGRYTTDGSEPGPGSLVVNGPVRVWSPTTIKAAVLMADGRMGPVTEARLDVQDRTAPTVVDVVGAPGSPRVVVRFSEPVSGSAADASRYTFEPAVGVQSVELAADGESAALTLATPPTPGVEYRLKISGVADRAPAGNAMGGASASFRVPKAVFTLDQIGADRMGTSIRDVAGLPVKASDSWTINVFVRVAAQPVNRTVLVGFGACDDAVEGGGRFLAKFGEGLHFWSHRRDASGSAKLDLNRWQMLTATYDGRVLRLYRDGRAAGSQAVTLADAQNVVHIAPVDPWEKKLRLGGRLHGLSVFDRVLTEDQLRLMRDAAVLPE